MDIIETSKTVVSLKFPCVSVSHFPRLQVWIIIILSLDKNKTIPKTTEWCFNDGAYCEAGFEIMVNGFKPEDKGKYELDFLNHCLVCQGCRCASFKPKEWHEIVNKIEQIRKNQ